MPVKKITQKNKQKPSDLKLENEGLKVKVLVQMLDIKRDASMTRIYTAIQSIEENEKE